MQISNVFLATTALVSRDNSQSSPANTPSFSRLALTHGNLRGFTEQRRLQAITPDPKSCAQYNLFDPKAVIHSAKAWELIEQFNATFGLHSIDVIVIDTGVVAHEDLQQKLLGNVDFLPKHYNKTIANPHGTHVAGIISANRNNSKGISGVSPSAKILSYQLGDSEGKINPDYNKAIQYAETLNSRKVINLSWGSNSICFNETQTAINNVVASGAVIIALAGNDNLNFEQMPSSCADVISVVATDEFGKKADYSNFGNIDIFAPGTAITSTLLNNEYGQLSGTSMATPHVSAVVTDMLSINPTFDNQQILNILQLTATPFEENACTPGEGLCGPGILNHAAAVNMTIDITLQQKNLTRSVLAPLQEDKYLNWGKPSCFVNDIPKKYDNKILGLKSAVLYIISVSGGVIGLTLLTILIIKIKQKCQPVQQANPEPNNPPPLHATV